MHRPPNAKNPSDHPVGRGYISQVGYIKMIPPTQIEVKKITRPRKQTIPTKVDSHKSSYRRPTSLSFPRARAPHYPCHSDARAQRDRRNLLSARQQRSRGCPILAAFFAAEPALSGAEGMGILTSYPLAERYDREGHDLGRAETAAKSIAASSR
jgi:hypothetical protein